MLFYQSVVASVVFFDTIFCGDGIGSKDDQQTNKESWLLPGMPPGQFLSGCGMGDTGQTIIHLRQCVNPLHALLVKQVHSVLL